MMEAWRKIRLGDACVTNADSYSPKEEWKFVNYLDTGNITNNRIDSIQYIDVGNDKLPGRARRKVKKDSIIYSTVRPNQRHFGIIKTQPENFLVSTGFAVIDVDAGMLDADFLYYLLTQPTLVEALHAIAEQSTSAYPSIKPSDIEDLEIEVPDLDTQKRIADILGSLDGKIAQNAEINENLQQQAQALFKKWFIDNPDAALWQEGTFSDLIEKTISGDWGKDKPSGNNTEMVYCIRGADIPEVRAGNKGKMPIRYILPKNFASKQLVNGDIVVEISGGSPTQSTGRAAAISSSLLARYDKGMVCTNFCKALKPITGYSMYVYHYWQYLYDRGVFFSYENGTTGIKNLDISGFIETEPIFIAPAELVKKFDTFCQSVFSKVYANGLESEQLALVRDTLLPKLMSGEIDVNDIRL